MTPGPVAMAALRHTTAAIIATRSLPTNFDRSRKKIKKNGVSNKGVQKIGSRIKFY